MECRNVTFFVASFLLICSILNTSRAAPLAPPVVKNMQEAVATINEMIANQISQFSKGGPNCKDCENVKQLLSQVPVDFFQFDIDDFVQFDTDDVFQGPGFPFGRN